MAVNGARRLIEISDTLPPHFQEYLTKGALHQLGKGYAIPQMYQL